MSISPLPVLLLVDNTEVFASVRALAAPTMGPDILGRLRLDLRATTAIVLQGRTALAKVATVHRTQRTPAGTLYSRAGFTTCDSCVASCNALMKYTLLLPGGTLIYVGTNASKYQSLLLSLPATWRLEIFTFELAVSTCLSSRFGHMSYRTFIWTLDAHIKYIMFEDCRGGVNSLRPSNDRMLSTDSCAAAAQKNLGPIGPKRHIPSKHDAHLLYYALF